MKITRCDKCGLTYEGPNPINEGFHSVLNPDGKKEYIDLCFTCYNAYYGILKEQEKQCEEACIQWLKARTVRKSCATCKYGSQNINCSPCDACADPDEGRRVGDWYKFWEPKEENDEK